jgi:hypothetical protein
MNEQRRIRRIFLTPPPSGDCDLPPCVPLLPDDDWNSGGTQWVNRGYDDGHLIRRLALISVAVSSRAHTSSNHITAVRPIAPSHALNTSGDPLERRLPLPLLLSFSSSALRAIKHHCLPIRENNNTDVGVRATEGAFSHWILRLISQCLRGILRLANSPAALVTDILPVALCAIYCDN